MIFDEELVTHIVSMTSVHISQAIDMYLQARDEALLKNPPYIWIQSRHKSISSIIHSFSALESVVSETGHQLFFEEDSYLYVPREKRNFALRKVVSNWKYTSCLDKFHLIVEQISTKAAPLKLAAELMELNNLRNWLLHGFVYKATLLLEKKNEEKGTFTLVDREDSVKWSNKFPNTKFSALDELDECDAKKALIISLSAIKLMYEYRQEPLVIISYYYGPHYHLVEDNDKNAETILEEYFAKASNKSQK
ncbi:MAG: hypothetical protein P9L92_06205 [Candidatus Electryonea clarkiae]|nr:hypothetical protein [Candidatus Electryonea clarkiae]